MKNGTNDLDSLILEKLEGLSQRIDRLEERKGETKGDLITLLLALIGSAASIINAVAKLTGH